MLKKGFAAIVILLAIVVSTIFAVGGFWIGRSTGTKLEVKPVTTSDTNQAKSTPSPISPSPTPNPELTFPSTCISPPAEICTEVGGGPAKMFYKTLGELNKDSELIVVGHVSDSCLYEDLTIKSETSSFTPYVGHLVIEKSLKNLSRLETPIVLTATVNKFFSEKTFSSTCVILVPGRSYLLFLEKHPSEKYYMFVDSPLEIQNSAL